MEEKLASEFISQSIFRMDESTQRISRCLELLPEDAVWKRPNETSNSIGNLILHLCGNIRQYAISSLGGASDSRERDAEFAAREGFTKQVLQEKLIATAEEAKMCILRTSVEELLRVRSVQGFELSGMGIIIHVTEHYSYHTGQIAFWTKILQNQDLRFYGEIDLNVKNE
ncbi:MAG TPA: DinB family protein [Saprospiraceae bacterium]|nr:DinB family protein [Saprospiraceae bacterium]HPI05734.1 DinB family protein [Saprospiraceae bacterium]